MMTSPAESREPLSDSPWFWIYLFGTAALILLIAFRGKLETRQAQIERQHQAREMTWRTHTPDDAEATNLSTPEDTVVQVDTLVAVLGMVVVAGWIRLWYVRYGSRSSPPSEPKV